ncbi:MAG TPA: glycosyltransferase family 4 protein [Solirubrobacteraceae bacterium]|nr:glycosyltransferase family 4 protein [Solirubrobacteraceae bacterium]
MSPAVLILSWEYPPIVEGGLARHVGKLSRGLAATGVEVHVLTRGDRLAPAEEEVDGVRVHRSPAAGWPADPGRFVAWVGRMNHGLLETGVELAGRVDFDLIHGHDWLVADAAEGLADRLSRPLVMTIHATEYGRHQGWIVGAPPARIHQAERRIVHRADRVIACSEFMAGHIADVFSVDETRIDVIPNGVDPADLAEAAPGPLGRLRGRFARPGQPLVLMVGRLVYEKGFQVGLDALRLLTGRHPGLRFVIAGTGIHEAQLRAHATRLDLDRHGSFVGWVGDERLGLLYRIADVCVVPSIYEPAGLVALEAMACGCPCVVADTGGLREAVRHGETGLRFVARDADSLAAMVDLMLGDRRLREKVVRAGHDHAVSFDWTAAATATAAAYGDLLDTSRRVAGRREP